jgi:hypothetical protein
MISNFKLNREKKINILLIELKKFIETFVNNKIILDYINFLSKELELPNYSIKREFKIILFRNFENEKGCFKKNFYFYNFFFYTIYFFFFFYL